MPGHRGGPEGAAIEERLTRLLAAGNWRLLDRPSLTMNYFRAPGWPPQEMPAPRRNRPWVLVAWFPGSASRCPQLGAGREFSYSLMMLRFA